MTIAPTQGPDATGSVSEDAAVSRPVVRDAMRQRKARQRRRRATIVWTVLTVVFVAALIALAFLGWRSSLKLTGGQDLKVTDPEAPGYVAEVKPTTADLIAVTGADGGLATMLLVLGGADSSTTTIVPISAWLTLWGFEDAKPASAHDLFASGGIDVLQVRLGADLTFGTTDTITVPASAIERLATSVGPLDVNLPDAVLQDDGAGGSVVRYPAGPLTLQPGEVMEFLSVQGKGEAELNRSLRLSQVWAALLGDGAATAATSSTSPADATDDLSTFQEVLTDVADSQVSVQLLPTNEVPLFITPPKSLDQVDRQAMSAWVPKYVPFPISAYPGQRATVNLLNGTTSADAIKAVAPKVVASGGEIALTGNADSFDVATSTVQYRGPGAKAAAAAIAAQLGLTATESTATTDRVDVTVVVGKDLVP